MKNRDDILKLYEDFILYDVKINVGDDRYFDYVAPSSLHSGITTWAYGKAKHRLCFEALSGVSVNATFTLPSADRKFYLKLICCLVKWEKFVNDITLSVNGKEIHKNQKEFIENVNLGWPALYFEIPEKVLKSGENIVSLITENSSEAGLLISEMKVISLPRIEPFSQISALNSAKKNEIYSVAFSAPADSFTDVSDSVNCKFIDVKYFNKNICVLRFVSENSGSASCKVHFGDMVFEAFMPQIFENNDFCLVGIDCDDHRQDESFEAFRVSHEFSLSSMGNLFLLRPEQGRNYHELPPQSVVEERIAFLRAMGSKIGITDFSKVIPYAVQAADDGYFLSHVHEPYLFYNLKIEQFGVAHIFLNDEKAVLSCKTFGEAEKLYRDVLRRRREMVKSEREVFSIGSPSLLSIYESDCRFEYSTIEPVSNMGLLVGSVRRLKNWGAHIPTDWYFGAPVDLCKSRKFRLALNYLYLNGASYVYPENAVYKTNAFDRMDWESEFCSTNRQYLRDFFDYTVRNPRPCAQTVELAVLYGNHENFLWQNDDRIAELTPDDWDTKVWGKWEDKHRECWKAVRAWLPVAESQRTYESPVNRDIFSGTPYGNVDIVSINKDWSNYKTVALLGWNTMTDEILKKIKSFVFEGGTVVMSYCHFNETDCNDKPSVFPDNGHTKELLGMEKIGEFVPHGEIAFSDEKIRVKSTIKSAEFKNIKAKILAEDSNGNGVVFENKYGNGRIILIGFSEYARDEWAVDVLKNTLSYAGENSSVKCDNKNVFFARFDLPDGRTRFDILNMNCAEENGEERYELTFKNNKIRGLVTEGKIKTVYVD